MSKIRAQMLQPRHILTYGKKNFGLLLYTFARIYYIHGYVVWNETTRQWSGGLNSMWHGRMHGAKDHGSGLSPGPPPFPFKTTTKFK
jgi:hypothetical protein